jgi:hypothetical protein
MPCKKSTLKKYRGRPSPPYPAQDCRGQRKKGSDGTWYVSVTDIKGIYRWKKEGKKGKNMKTQKMSKGVKGSKGAKSYKILDNGGIPYHVDVYADHIKIIRIEDGIRKGVIYETKYDKIWLGDNLLKDPLYAPRGWNKGNSILVGIGPTYVYIGSVIYRFEAPDEIVNYYSPIGNNDSPYPYAIGNEYSYFFLDMKRVLTSLLDRSRDGYTQFYKEVPDEQKKGFRVKMIDSRD